jgi:hypothetical protein
MPRACPGESHVYCYLALNVNLHGTSPWHPVFIAETIGVATNASLHGTRPWHLRLRFANVTSSGDETPSSMTSTLT